MNLRIVWFVLIFGINLISLSAQRKSITFETNGSELLKDNNPFHRFIGEWTLKEDSWTQNWGGDTETISIPEHHTVSTQINTSNSLLSIIDGPQPNGHIFWSYNPITKEIGHLSSFGELRAGVGKGHFSANGTLHLKISFEGEPEGTYRKYTYTWVNKDEYHMKSIQYDTEDQPTGWFYEGSFVRISGTKERIKKEVENILSVLDNQTIAIQEQLRVYSNDIVHMAPGSHAHMGKEALGNYLREQRKLGKVNMKHHIIEIESLNQNMVLMRGEVSGTFVPANQTSSTAFRTKNLFVFEKEDGFFKIKKVIYNTSPLE